MVLSQLAVLPAGKPLKRADPKRPITRDEQASYIGAREIFTRWRLPWHGSNAIESQEPEFRAQPQITVACLRYRGDCALRKPIADLPRRVRVLAHVQRRIQRQRTRAPRQQPSQSNAWRETKSSSSVGVFHGSKSYSYLSQRRASPASLF